MASGKTTFPSRRAAAVRNRDKILSAARDAFADPAAEVSMAEVARRAGVGMATLYRNFPGRDKLLEALCTDEVNAVCDAAETVEGTGFFLGLTGAHGPGSRFVAGAVIDRQHGAARQHEVEDSRAEIKAVQTAVAVQTLDKLFDLGL